MNRGPSPFAAARARVRTWVEGIYALDDRLYERMLASRTVVFICTGLALASVLAAAVLGWWSRADAGFRLTMAALVLGAAAALVLGARHRLRTQRADLAARRLSAGRCPVCSYDLRATPNAGGALLDRCPECGATTSGGDEAAA